MLKIVLLNHGMSDDIGEHKSHSDLHPFVKFVYLMGLSKGHCGIKIKAIPTNDYTADE